MRRLSMVLVVVLAAGLLTACDVPTGMTVTTTADVVDADPGDGLCETATAGECSLRAAVQEANALGTPVEVTLQAATSYTLSLTGALEDAAATGDLDVTGDVRIVGQGSSIRGTGDRVIDNFGSLRLEDLTVTGGVRDGYPGDEALGGGIRNQGKLGLLGVTLRANQAAGGAAVHQMSGEMVIHDALIVENAGTDVGSAAVSIEGGTLVMIRSVVYRNLPVIPDSLPPGTYESLPQVRQAGGDLTIIDSTVGGSRAEFTYCIWLPTYRCFYSALNGDGVEQVAGTLSIDRSTIVGNATGLSTAGTAEISGTVVATNLRDCEGTVSSGGYNLDEDGTCLDGLDPTDQPATASLLPAIVPPSYAVAPPAASPLVDAIPVGTPFLCDDRHPVDQRGEPRPSGAACDIGAIERQPTDP